MCGCVVWAVAAILSMLAQGTHSRHADGFFGYAWGTQLSRIEQKFDLQLIERSGSHATYAANLPRLDDADIDECHFEFVHDRLAGVVLLTRGGENSRRLLKYLRRHLGEGQQSEPTAFSWLSGDVHVSFDMDSYGDGYLYWYSLVQQQE